MFRIGQPSRSGQHHSGNDEAHLARIGRKPVIRRKYGAWTMFAFSCIILDGWSGVLFTFQIGYVNGGSAGLVYGYIIAWLGTMATFASLAEMSSMAPVSAAQYYWSAMLWPRGWANLISYVTGWMMVLGWQAGTASGAFAAGLLTQMFIQVVNPDYVPELWHTTLLYYAALLLALVASFFSGKPLTWIQTGAFILYICGFLGVMVTVVALADRADATTVFTSFQNGGGWSSEGLSFMIGLAGVVFDFLGADCVYHMSEEVHNARIVVPWAITSAIGVGGLIGILALIGILFCIPNPETVLTSEYAYPFAAVFLQATKSRAGSAVMIMVIVILQAAAVAALLPTAARMLWAFARDRGVPLSSLISKVHDKSSIPRNAILVTVTISTLVGLISLGSPLAFNDLVSLTISALAVSYLIACLGLLFRRLSGDIEPFSDHSTELVNIPGSEKKLAWGPWHIPGVLGTLVNAWACVYLIVVIFFSFWPTATPVSPSSMNYSVLLFGAVALLSTGYYLLRAKKTFKGSASDVRVFDESYEHEEKR